MYKSIYLVADQEVIYPIILIEHCSNYYNGSSKLSGKSLLDYYCSGTRFD